MFSFLFEVSITNSYLLYREAFYTYNSFTAFKLLLFFDIFDRFGAKVALHYMHDIIVDLENPKNY